MRQFLMMAVCAAALSLSACDTSETYPVSVTDAWAKVSSGGYSAITYGLPAGLHMAEVRASFESFPGDRTGYWKFTRKGKELGRLNVAVEGDETSSTISYSYAGGDISDEDKKSEQMIRQFSQTLLAEAIDARMENRSPDMGRKSHADAQSSAAMMGAMMKQVDKSMSDAAAQFEQADRDAAAGQAHSQVVQAKANSTKPTTDLSGY
jgi:hypothetical protein